DDPQPWTARLAVVWMLLPVLAICVLVLLFRRHQMLRIWRYGSEAVGRVVEVRQSAIAPRSRFVRLAVEGSGNRRVLTTLFPYTAGEIHKDDELVVLMSPGNASR